MLKNIFMENIYIVNKIDIKLALFPTIPLNSWRYIYVYQFYDGLFNYYGLKVSTF